MFWGIILSPRKADNMKLVYIANARIPTEKAHGLQIMKMCESFAKKGLEVELIVPSRWNKIKEDPFRYYNVQTKFRITKIPIIDLIPLGFGKYGLFVQSIWFLLLTKLYLLFKKYDLIYTREQLTVFFFNKAIYEIHNLPAKILGLHKIIWHKAHKIVAITKHIGLDLAKNGVAKNKIFVAHDGVDDSLFAIVETKQQLRKKLGLPSDKKIIAYTGSFYLYSWKGVDIFLAAAEKLNDKYLAVLVGGNREDIVKNYRNKKIPDNIKIIGHQPHHKIPYYLKAADVLVLPNKKGNVVSERYTSPLKLFEYMCSSTPIVASKLPSICEVLDRQTAILVEPNDPAALAQGVERLCTDKKNGETIAFNAKLKVKNYTWLKRAENILKFVNKK